MLVGEARKNLVNKNFTKAAELLKPMAMKEDDNQLVFLLEYATALQLAAQYDESNKMFLMADRMSEIQDYHSVSNITSSLLFSEKMVQYKGEDYEKVLINAFAATNYLMLNDLESALVEARRLNEKLIKYKNEAKLPYEQNAFARYLSAMAWESNGKWDDAYIDYLECYKLNPNIPMLRADLIRVAKKANRMEDFAKWKKQFPAVEYKNNWDDKKYGEIVLIFQQGWGPVKRPDPIHPRFPRLYQQYSRTKAANLKIEGQAFVPTEEIYDISETSIKSFNDQIGGLIAKRIAGLVAKEVVADQIRQKNGALGDVAYLVMHISDQADTRHWSMLPETLQVSRLRLPAGEYQVSADGLDSSGSPTGESMDTQAVLVKPRKASFVVWRSLQ
ncbi:MAG: hypothetical protein SGJ18_06155 [Pseudomonadota bacterium]|nr:hypothetical protein [Pseudomonadota bacterium]